jgi:hypothetical protein
VQGPRIDSFALLPNQPFVSALAAVLLNREPKHRIRLEHVLGHLCLKHDRRYVMQELHHLHGIGSGSPADTRATAALETLLKDDGFKVSLPLWGGHTPRPSYTAAYCSLFAVRNNCWQWWPLLQSMQTPAREQVSKWLSVTHQATNRAGHQRC